jgi:pimeloyl-ACP methyl ester carboxylesterase
LTLRTIVFGLLLPLFASAATTALYSPFPSDVWTVSDPLQKTGLRVNLPAPDCKTQVTACKETALLNQLDGFSLRARVAVQFSGPVDLASAANGIYLIAIDSRKRVTLDQVEFDPVTNTVYGKPASVLDQGKRYAVIVTGVVTDRAGVPVAADPAFQACLKATDAYCSALAAAVAPLSLPVVGGSMFTTMSATGWLEAARTLVANTPPGTALLTPQSTFPISTLATFVLHEQTGANPTRFTDLALPITASLLAGLDRITIGSFQSPNYLQSDQTIAAGPSPLATNTIYFNALLPAANKKPAAGYPVVIFGHGFGDSRWGGPTAVSPTLANNGFAVIAINAVGHGFGPLSTVSFTDKTEKTVTVPAGGRGVDVNGNGSIDSEEGCALVAPVAIGLRDCFRQTVVDLMQLAHAIRTGIDLDGDGTPDLDASRIYYAGESLGAMYGTVFTAVEPTVRAAMLNVGGGSTVDIARWSPSYRDLTIEMLGMRVPELLNRRANYNEDYVLPGQEPHVVRTPGAMAIQNVFETLDWLSMQGDPMAFAPHLSLAPLAGTAVRPVLWQFARADRTMPNPATTNLIKAAGGQSSTWEYRHDLARAKAPDLPLNPHPFLALFVSLDGSAIQLPGLAGLSITLDAQQQMAGFFGVDGASIPDANMFSSFLFGLPPVFEQPATLPLDFGYADFHGFRHVPVLR